MPPRRRVKYLQDGVYKDRYIRAFHKDRETIIVQVWNTDRMIGDPDGEWEMPSRLQLISCIEQAILNTPESIGWAKLIPKEGCPIYREDVLRLLAVFKKHMILIAEDTEPKGDYTGRDEDGGSFWESDAERTRDEVVRRLNEVSLKIE